MTKGVKKCIQDEVTPRFIILLGSLVAVAAGGFLRADDAPPPKAKEGFHMVKIGEGAYIQVQDERNPFKNVRGTEGTTDNKGFNMTNPMAGKKYDLGTASAHDDGSFQRELKSSFITKSYFANHEKHTETFPDTVQVHEAVGFKKSATDTDKTFMMASSDQGQHKTASFSGQTSSYQGKSADLGGHEFKKYASSMNGKTYQGPEAAVVKRELAKMNEGMLGIKDLPDRALTVDEVRALINHGVKPDTGAAPPPAGRPLNAPDYEPDNAPAPLRSSPDEDAHHLRDSNDVRIDGSDGVVPSPGMMAHPESSEPLPK